MKFNRIKILILSLIILLGVILIFRNFFKGFYYDFIEHWTLRDKIVWTESIEITWKDFKDYEHDGFFPKVGLSSRYDVNDPILFRSKTVFVPNDSYATDTTKIFNLRIAKAKIDLLETYRRRMVRFVDSLREHKIDYYKPSDFKRLNRKFYDEFDEEWIKFLNSEKKLESLILLEEKINKTLYKNNNGLP